ncbi:MAG: aryl-alcohol dehydrogenase [Acidimicrobiales bacterium]|jgi:aryl-alcohol dehydrogenase
MKTTAAVLHQADGVFTLEQVEIEEPRAGEVRVKLVATGMCHTDLSMREAHRPTPYPVVLGHEGSGHIEAVGPGVTGLSVGQPVVLSYVSCGHCANCLRGERTYCSNMWALNFNCCRLDGTAALRLDDTQVGSHFFGQSSFSAHAVVPVASVVPVDDDAPLELLGPLGCGVQTGAGAVMNVFRPRPGQSIAIFGCGAVGLSALLAAVAVGCGPIIGVDVHAGRLAKATELGATATITSSDDVVAQILEATDGRGVDFAFDAVGAPGTFEAGVGALAPRGTFGFVAAGAPDAMASVSPRHVLFGRTITGILEGDSIPQQFIPELIELHRAGRFPFDELITTFPLDQINEAEAASHHGEVIKPVLLMP